MNTLNDFFDRIYCINLDKRPDRYELCLKEFEKLNIEVERVSAIDGSQIFKAGDNVNAGNFGLLLTQKQIILDAKSKGYKNFLLLEDDVMFIEYTNQLFYNKIHFLPEFWNMLYLGGNNVFGRGTYKPITGDVTIKVTAENYRELNHELCRTTWTQCAHAVAFNSNFYDILLAAMEEYSNLAGDSIHVKLQQQGYPTYTFLPSLVLQRGSFSDIENKYVDYNTNIGNSF